VSALEDPGISPEIDVLIGHTAHEGTFFFDSPWRPAPAPERVPGIVAHLCPDEDPGAVLGRYGGDLVAIATDAIVAAPLERWARARASAGAHLYRYRVDHPGAGRRLLATHTAEVPLLFGTWNDGGPGERLGGQAPEAAPVAERITQAWASFLHGEGPGWDAEQLGVLGGERPLTKE
jgi:para-nitrobenzyl esterase